MNIKIGFGYDVHKLVNDRDLWIGGVKIPFEKGSLGHSDADVLLHAICDALLGAACLHDIGTHFPDTDPQYKGIDSKILLEKTFLLIKQKGFSIGNIDSTICLQKPKIMTFIPQMRNIIANILQITMEEISIKATTTEHMGFVGSGEGISAYATVLLYKN